MKHNISILLIILMFNSKIFSYSWPVYPYTTQPRINGTFMEVRSNSSGTDKRDHMHTGVDLQATGYTTPIAPVCETYIDEVNKTAAVPYIRTCM